MQVGLSHEDATSAHCSQAPTVGFAMTQTGLTEERALHAFATMMNRGEVERFEPLLHERMHYESQWSFHDYAAVWVPYERETKGDYVAHIRERLATIESSGQRVFAEMGRLPDRPCVILAEGDKDNLVATVLVDVKDGTVRRLELCTVPDPCDAERTGEYPG